MSKGTKILITGLPGVGKTTLIVRLAETLREHYEVRGFVTEEVRETGRRVGFKLRTFHGKEGWLARVGVSSPYRVGKYAVLVKEFEQLALEELTPAEGQVAYVIDEIGKMECFSRDFIEAVRRLMRSPQLLIATVARKGGGLIAEVKQMEGATILEITPRNRDQLAGEILTYLGLREGHAT